MPLREDILNPIAGDNPSGRNLRSSADLRQDPRGAPRGRRTPAGRLADRAETGRLDAGHHAVPGSDRAAEQGSAACRLADRSAPQEAECPRIARRHRALFGPGHSILGHAVSRNRRRRNGRPGLSPGVDRLQAGYDGQETGPESRRARVFPVPGVARWFRARRRRRRKRKRLATRRSKRAS